MVNRLTNLLLPLWVVVALVTTGCQTPSRSGQATRAPASPTVAPPPSSRPVFPPPHADDDMRWVSMAYPSGNPQTSIVGVEKALPRQVRVNIPFNYMIRVTNLADLTLNDVIVVDKLGTNTKINSSSPRGQLGPDGLIKWPLGSIEPQGTKTIEVTAVASEAGSFNSCAFVSYNSLLCADVTVTDPKLQLELEGMSEVLRCDDIVYTLKVTNTGTGTMQNVRIADPLPAGLVSDEGLDTAVFDVGTLSAGQSREFTLLAKATKTGEFVNQATVTEDALNETSNEVKTVVTEPVLQITKSAPQTIYLGRSINYQISVTNAGTGEARDTVVEDEVPAGTKLTRIGEGGQNMDGKVRWELGTIAPSATKTVNLSLKSDRIGTVSSTAVASAYCAETVSALAQTEYKGIPAILLEVIDLDDPIEMGQEVTYQVTATNQGSATGTNIQIDCELEDNVQYVSSSGATRAGIRPGGLTFEPLPRLAAGEKARWQIVVKAMKVGDVRFKVTLNSDQLSRPVKESEATNLYQ